MEQWQAEMRRLKIEYFKSISKEFYRLNGGDNMIVRPHSDGTAQGFINCIVDYLGYNGICTEVEYTSRGFASIKADVNGQQILVSVRVKIMKNRKGELLTTPNIPKPGQLHFVAHNMASFMQWFKLTFAQAQVYAGTLNCIGNNNLL